MSMSIPSTPMPTTLINKATTDPEELKLKLCGDDDDDDGDGVGDWKGTKMALRNPDCCVVSVPGLEQHIATLQTYFVENGPADLDLRARVNIKKADIDAGDANADADANADVTREDCLAIRLSVTSTRIMIENGKQTNEKEATVQVLAEEKKAVHDIMMLDDPCTDALVELARGMASLAETETRADGSTTSCEYVFLRIVCASNYKAIDPSFHTDKCPLRGYVTLTGIGTEYMSRTCTPMEYVTLRAMGMDMSTSTTSMGGGGGISAESLVQAQELEFIVMKGDEYQYHYKSEGNSFWNKLWKRRFACVHRSPPAAENGGRRRVIVSLDLGDGKDDREWYQVGKKREWRSGMTQRKSRLVA